MSEYQNQWYIRNKERLLLVSKAYRQNNPEKVKEYRRLYALDPKNREKKLSYSKQYYKDNKTEMIKYGVRRQRNQRKKNLDSWREYFGNNHVCECCKEKKLIFSSGTVRDSICFDHRHGGEERIKASPTVWLASHTFSEKNKEIWESCNFGILCHLCNSRLPTIDRKQWINKVIQYIER